MATWLLSFNVDSKKGEEILKVLQTGDSVFSLPLEDKITKHMPSIGDLFYIWISRKVSKSPTYHGIYAKAMLTEASESIYTFKNTDPEYTKNIYEKKTEPIKNKNKSINPHKFIGLYPLTLDDLDFLDSEWEAIEYRDNKQIGDVNLNKQTENKIIKLQGIVSRVLGTANRNVSNDTRKIEKGYELTGGVNVLRGFAPYKLLKDLHITDKGYQRELNPVHKDSLVKYIESAKNFIPEIIYAFRSNDENKYLSQVALSSGSETQRGIIKNLDYYTLEIPIDKKLYCIDGNHRMKAIESLYKEKKELLIPFCIIFVPEKSDEENFIFNEPSYFFNLNGRSEPLVYGETFKYLAHNLKDKKDIEKDLSCYKFFEMLNKLDQLNIYQIFDKNVDVEGENENKEDKIKDSRLGELLFQVYKKHEDKIIADKKIVDILETTIKGLYSHDCFSDSYIITKCNDILPALVLYLYYENDESTTKMHNDICKISDWLSLKNLTAEHFYSIEKLLLQYEQYKSVKTVNIFMAMPFEPKDNVDAMNEYKKELLEKLNSKHKNCKIEFPEIMREKSEAREMWDDIREKIYNADIIICDITNNNINVIYEMGIAYGRKKKLLVICHIDTGKIPFDIHQLYQIKYQDIEKKKFKDELFEKINNIITNKLNCE